MRFMVAMLSPESFLTCFYVTGIAQLFTIYDCFAKLRQKMLLDFVRKRREVIVLCKTFDNTFLKCYVKRIANRKLYL